MTNPKVLSKEDNKEFKSNFESNDKNLFAQNVVHEHGPSNACLNPKAKLAISDKKEKVLERRDLLEIPVLEQSQKEQEEYNRNERLMRVNWARQMMRDEEFQGDLDEEVDRLTFLVDHYYELTTMEQQYEFQHRYFWARNQMTQENFQGTGFQQSERLNYLMENFNDLSGIITLWETCMHSIPKCHKKTPKRLHFNSGLITLLRTTRDCIPK